MNKDIINTDKSGRLVLNHTSKHLTNLYRTLYNRPDVNQVEYELLLELVEKLLGKILMGFDANARSDTLNFAWGLCKIAGIKGSNISNFFYTHNNDLLSYEGHSRVVQYVNLCLTGINATINSQITQEKMPASAYKTIEQIDELSERITESEKVINQMVETARGAVKEMGERLDEAEKKLSEKDDELKKVRVEKDRMNSEEFRDEVGREYIKKVFEEYLKDADEMEQSLRKDWFNVLQGFCSIEGVPKEVKKMIQSLKRKPKGSDGMTVNTQTYVETQNNNYK